MSQLSGLWLLALVLVVGLVACQGERVAPQTATQAPAPMPAAPSTTYTPPAPAPTYMPPPAPTQTTPSMTTPPAVQAQIDRGIMLYAQNCASCHGARGEGSSRAPAVIGGDSLPLDPPPGARLRRVRFQSAMDLGLFIKNNMPLNGQHLPPQDVACILAWLLQEHGRTPTQPISPATAGAITR